MNKVWIELETPESIWSRGDCNVSEDGTMRYEAKFYKTGTSSKPVHLGPAISLVVLNAQGKEVARHSATLGGQTDGTLFFQFYKEVQSELENTGLLVEYFR